MTAEEPRRGRARPISEAIVRLEQAIAEEAARRDWLLDQIQRMQGAG